MKLPELPSLPDLPELPDMSASTALPWDNSNHISIFDGPQPTNPIEPETEPDPYTDLPEATGDLDTDSLAELMAIKAEFQRQDHNQKQQFRDLYNIYYFHSDVYPNYDECTRSLELQARILGIPMEHAEIGSYRDGRVIYQAMRKLAERLGIDPDATA